MFQSGFLGTDADFVTDLTLTGEIFFFMAISLGVVTQRRGRYRSLLSGRAMDIRARHFHDVAILSVDGRLDSASAPQLEQAIDEQVGAGYVRLVVDLQKVDYLNSTGIKTLVQGAQMTRQQGGGFRIAHAHAQVRYVLHLAGVNTLIQMFPDVVGATVSFLPGSLPGES